MANKSSETGPRARGFVRLANLAYDSMLQEISAGMPILLKSAANLAQTAELLNSERKGLIDKKADRSAGILALHAEEEAAKILMLLDLVRCPSERQKDRSRLAKSISCHLARLIYVELSSDLWHWDNLSDLRDRIDRYRSKFYLDGPSGFDYIFQNELIFQRESSIYTDYYCWGASNYLWHDPEDFGRGAFLNAVPIVGALEAVGVLTLEGLQIVGEVWREENLSHRTTSYEAHELNKELKTKLQYRKYFENADAKDVQLLMRWHPPLYMFDLNFRNVDVADLEEFRDKLFMSSEGLEN